MPGRTLGRATCVAGSVGAAIVIGLISLPASTAHAQVKGRRGTQSDCSERGDYLFAEKQFADARKRYDESFARTGTLACLYRSGYAQFKRWNSDHDPWDREGARAVLTLYLKKAARDALERSNASRMMEAMAESPQHVPAPGDQSTESPPPRPSPSVDVPKSPPSGGAHNSDASNQREPVADGGRGGRGARAWTWVAAAVAVGAVGGGVWSRLLAVGIYDETLPLCEHGDATGCSDGRARADSQNVLTVVFFSAAGAAAIVAAILFVNEPTWSVAPTENRGAFVSRSWRF